MGINHYYCKLCTILFLIVFITNINALEFEVNNALPGYKKNAKLHDTAEKLLIKGNYDSVEVVLNSISATNHFNRYNSNYKRNLRYILKFLRSYKHCTAMDSTISTDSLCECFENTRFISEQIPPKLNIGNKLFSYIDSIGQLVYIRRNNYCIKNNN